MEKPSIFQAVFLMSGEWPFNNSAQYAPSGLGRSASLRAPGAGRYASTIMIRIMAITSMLFLSGCAPTIQDYYKPSVEGGSVAHRGPNIVGPSDATLIKRHGYEIRVSYRGYLDLVVFVPEGHALNVVNNKVLVSYDGKKFQEVSLAHFWTWEEENKDIRYLVGRPRANILQKHGTSYMAEVGLGDMPDRFIVRLPTFESTQHNEIVFPDVTFQSETGFAVTLIN